MNNNPRQDLMELIEALRLPFDRKEARNNMEKLSDEELGILISVYKDVLNYRSALENVARLAKPQELSEIQMQYADKFEKLDMELADKLEEIQEEEDEQMDEAEEGVLEKMDEVVEMQVAGLKELGEVQETLYSKITTYLSKGN